MRLFLSSQGFGDHSQKLLELLGEKHKAAFIDNAKDYLPESERAMHVREKQLEFENLGLEFSEIDLRDYFDKSGIQKELEKYDLVWLSGGNTFILRRAMAQSGFDKVIKNLMSEDRLVYGGSSAGSIVAAPSLRGLEDGDDPENVPKGYQPEVIWDGLKLVDYYVIPHYKSDWYGANADKIVAYMKQHNLKHYALKDGQVVWANGEKVQFLK